MRILYLSCHSILEFDEVKLFTELGHDVFSFGSYRNPNAPHDPKRPAIIGTYHPELEKLIEGKTQADLPEELIEWADVVMVMHVPDWIIKNWKKLKKKKVIWRSIGQSCPEVEGWLAYPRSQGLLIVRYSPAESGIPGFLGEDRMIRFYKDPEEFRGYVGQKPMVITVAQSMLQRASHCNYEAFRSVTENFPRMLLGTPSHNPDGSLMPDGLWGGELTFDELKNAYRDYRVYMYTGTYPASYTLNFIEAWMTGIPIVAIGPKLANLNLYPGMQTYEVSQLITHRCNGFCSDDPAELRGNIDYLLQHPDEARKIGEVGRMNAIQHFGKDKIKAEWKTFFDAL